MALRISSCITVVVKPCHLKCLDSSSIRNAALNKTGVYEWFLRFKNGDMSIEDEPRLKRTPTSKGNKNVGKINAP